MLSETVSVAQNTGGPTFQGLESHPRQNGGVCHSELTTPQQSLITA